MITTCKTYLKNLLTDIQCEGVRIEPQHVLLQARAKNQFKVPYAASILAHRDRLKSIEGKVGQRILPASGPSVRLQFLQKRYLRELTLVLTLVAPQEHWLDAFLNELLLRLDRRIEALDGGVIEVLPEQIAWEEGEAILSGVDVAVLVVTFRQEVRRWEDAPHFATVHGALPDSDPVDLTSA